MKKIVLTAAILLAALPAMAQAPRAIDMTIVLPDLHGKPLIDYAQRTADDPDCKKCGGLTLGEVVATALLTERKDEPNVTAVEKAKRGALAIKLVNNPAAVLTAAETSEIIPLLNVWMPLVVADAIAILDPALDIQSGPDPKKP